MVIILPIVLVLLSANIWAFSIFITIICLLAMFEWFKSKLQKPIVGVFLILNFYFWSILFVISPGMYEEGVYVYGFYGILILNTAIFDSFAYLIGSKFGKTYIAKKISPNKTLEGLISGILGSMLFGIFVGYQIQDYGIILFFIFLCFLAFVGDLLISFIKRQSGVKDTGTILPGHGGILDRLDSHLIVIPVSIMILVL